MNIINTVINLQRNLLETHQLKFEAYKDVAEQIVLLDNVNQVKVISFLLPYSVVNDFFSFYSIILQEYIKQMRKIDSYDAYNISKIFINSLFSFNCHDINIIKFIDFLYPVDWSVLSSNYTTIASFYLCNISQSNDDNIISKYSEIIKYITDGGNFINENDVINFKLYIHKLYNKNILLETIKNRYNYIENIHMKNIINFVKSTPNNVLKIISEYSMANKLDINDVLNIKDEYNRPLIYYCCTYVNFLELYNCKLIYTDNKNLYKNYFQDTVKPLYQILYSNLDNPKFFITNHLGIVRLEDFEFTTFHNNGIKFLLKKYTNAYDHIWDYI